jgi:ribosome-binding factor A
MQGKAARLLRMRYTPEIRFEYDEGLDKADEMARLLRRLHDDEDDGPAES